MSKLSDRVYKILLENSKEKPHKRGNVLIGGMIDNLWKDDELTPKDIESMVSHSKQKNHKQVDLNKFKNPVVDIYDYDIEDEAEPIDYMTNDDKGGYCKSCNKGGRVKNNINKPKKKINSGLEEYNTMLNHIKNKGYSHKEAQQLMRQIKEEFGSDYKGGNFWKDFGRGFKKGFFGTLKTAAPFLPLLI
jgi:hypothetical protein